MATPGPSPSKLVDDSDTAVSPPQPSGNQQALEMEDVIEFVEPLPDELQCPLCLEFLKEPTLTSCCGHHFCSECINRAITRSHVCPLCNNQGFQTLLNKEKERLVNALKVYCKQKSRGCEWVGELGRLERHLDVEEGDCGCVEVECEFGPVGCVAKLPREELQRHKEENVHKHLVLMSVMSLKSNEAFVKELREQRVELEGQLRQQRVEFQQQLKQKDEDIQAIQVSLQQQVEELRSQLQQKDQQMQDELFQRVEKIATVQKNTEARQKITDLETQLKGEAEQLARVQVELTENAQHFIRVERKLQDIDQQLTMHERKHEKWLGDVERKRLEEKQEVRRIAAVCKAVQEAKTQSKENEKRLDDVERRQREEKPEINIQLANVDKRVAEVEGQLRRLQVEFQQQLKRKDEIQGTLQQRVEENQEVSRQVGKVDRKIQKGNTKFLQDWNPMLVETADYDLGMRIGQVETSPRGELDQAKELNEKPCKNVGAFGKKLPEDGRRTGVSRFGRKSTPIHGFSAGVPKVRARDQLSRGLTGEEYPDLTQYYYTGKTKL